MINNYSKIDYKYNILFNENLDRNHRIFDLEDNLG